MALDVSKLQVTSRDYQSIKQDLLNAVPLISPLWTASNEEDPFVVEIKLMSMLGDMLSYNHDKAVLEAFPKTVQELKNAVQVFSLAGYKMHWFISARAKVNVGLQEGETEVTLTPYSTFTDASQSLIYTYVPTSFNQTIALNQNIVTVELVQGIPSIPDYQPNITPNNWWDSYNYNVGKDTIIDGKIYFGGNNINVDQTSITLIDNAGLSWTQVNNVEQNLEYGRFYSLEIDENEVPYIQLVNYWDELDNGGITNFKLFYVLSDGIQGTVTNNTTLSNLKLTNGNPVVTAIVYETQWVSDGKNPETADEARKQYLLYNNTHDTLVTLQDYTNAIRRIPGVANCYCTDVMTDPNTTILPTVVKAYISRDEYGKQLNEEEFINTIKQTIFNQSLATTELQVYLDGNTLDIKFYPNKNNTTQTANISATFTIPNTNLILSDKINVSYDEINTQLNVLSDTGSSDAPVQIAGLGSLYSIYSSETNTLTITINDTTIGDTDEDANNYQKLVFSYILDSTIIPNHTNYFNWTPSGTLYTKKPVSPTTLSNIYNKINNNLSEKYSLENVSYNAPINFATLVADIESSDDNILKADLDALTYDFEINKNSVVYALYPTLTPDSKTVSKGTKYIFNLATNNFPKPLILAFTSLDGYNHEHIDYFSFVSDNLINISGNGFFSQNVVEGNYGNRKINIIIKTGEYLNQQSHRIVCYNGTPTTSLGGVSYNSLISGNYTYEGVCGQLGAGSVYYISPALNYPIKRNSVLLELSYSRGVLVDNSGNSIAECTIKDTSGNDSGSAYQVVTVVDEGSTIKFTTIIGADTYESADINKSDPLENISIELESDENSITIFLNVLNTSKTYGDIASGTYAVAQLASTITTYLSDNGVGKFLPNNEFDVMQSSINYTTGLVNLYMNNPIDQYKLKVTASYKQNVVNLCQYTGLDTDKLVFNGESVQ